MSERIDEMSNFNIDSDLMSLDYMSKFLTVFLRELDRVRNGALALNDGPLDMKNKPYEISLTFQDLDANCIDAIFSHLTMREKFAVERVSKQCHEGFLRALPLQKELIIISSNVEDAYYEKYYKRKAQIEFVYEKIAATKVIRMLLNVTHLTLVGFDVDYNRFGLVRKFPRLSKLTLGTCKVIDSDKWQCLKSVESV